MADFLRLRTARMVAAMVKTEAAPTAVTVPLTGTVKETVSAETELSEAV